ncbi:hypothetical protein K505DRAFT_324548, partial [Melanomma pulvis-pyrius CBS 109.77]
MIRLTYPSSQQSARQPYTTSSKTAPKISPQHPRHPPSLSSAKSEKLLFKRTHLLAARRQPAFPSLFASSSSLQTSHHATPRYAAPPSYPPL